MDGAVQLILGHPDYCMLLFLRTSGLLVGNPIFGHKGIPAYVKIAFSFAMMVLFINLVPQPQVWPQYSNIIGYGLLCLNELAFGLAMSFVMTAVFDLTLTAGSMIDMQIGFSMANIYDIQNGTQASITGSLYNIMFVILFLGENAHLRVIDILYHTIERVPIGHVTISPDIMWSAGQVMSETFALALMLSMPIIASGLMAEIAMGAMVRTVPQMNMFVVGIPVKILVGLVVLGTTFTMFIGFSGEMMNTMFRYIDQMFAYIT